MSKKLTQEEAERLINMLKNSLVSEIAFPEKGTAIEFDAIGSTKQDHFTTRIYRGRINSTKYEIGARIKKDGIMLLELHINPGKVHINPAGEKIIGSHWHIYTEEFGRKQAFPAEDLQSDLFVKNTLLFMEKFNIIEKPTVNFQLELL
mgnify:FL=1